MVSVDVVAAVEEDEEEDEDEDDVEAVEVVVALKLMVSPTFKPFAVAKFVSMTTVPCCFPLSSIPLPEMSLDVLLLNSSNSVVDRTPEIATSGNVICLPPPKNLFGLS